MIEVNRDALVQALADLVRIPSVNPDLVSGATGERRIAEAIADRLRKTPGIDVELQDAGDGRPNVIAATGNGNGRTLMLNGHIDTVTVEGMDEPFSAHVEGNRLYGRGTSDMKGAMAGTIVLLEALARAGDLPGRVIVTFVVDEEYASIGTQAICREIERWRPDAALVLEQTDLNVGIAHKGFIWADIETRGHAAHGSYWQTGIDAIAHMGRVIVAVEELSQKLVAQDGHPYVGPPSLHCSLIDGGEGISSYPERCRLQVERRTIPGETVEQVEQEFQTILDRLAADDPKFSATLRMGLVRDSFEIAQDAPIVQILSNQIEAELGQTPRLFGGAPWMDSAFLSAAGIPTAIFGPAGHGAHGHEEWVDLDSLESFTRILARTAYAFCGDGSE